MMILSMIENLFTIIHKNQWDKLSVDHPYSEYNKNTIKEITKNINLPNEQQQINSNDLEILLNFKHDSYLYEFQFRLIQIKFGLLNIINLLPFIGPFISLLLSFKLLLTIKKLHNKVPLDLQLLLLINILIEFGIGLIPLFGIFGGILYKANSRNYKLLQDYLINLEDYTIELSTLEIPVDEQEEKEPVQEEVIIPPSPVKVLDLLNKKSKNNTIESGSISSSSSSSIVNTGKSTSIATITTSNTNVMASPFQSNSTIDDSKIDQDSKSIKSIKTLSKLNHVENPKKNKKKKKKKKKTTE